VVTCLDEHRHGLEDGDWVTFSEVQGMTELNACSPRQIKSLGPYTFSISDVSRLSEYKIGGIFTQVKQPKVVKFKSLRETIHQAPECLISDFAKMDRQNQLHLAFQTLSAFRELNGGQLPRPHHPEDAKKFLDLAAAKLKSELKSVCDQVDEKLLTQFSFLSAGDLAPMNAVLGGLVAQEVLKVSHPSSLILLITIRADLILRLRCRRVQVNSIQLFSGCILILWSRFPQICRQIRQIIK
jgi:ubiquitin-activating enzyme E1